jgi:hypothetical protein
MSRTRRGEEAVEKLEVDNAILKIRESKKPKK